MTFATLFRGAGGADIGLERAGLTPLWASEIDPRCNAVASRHWPTVPNYGDVQTIATRAVAGEIAPVTPDVFWMSPPCQDLSVAGKRAGLAGARSGLFNDAVQLIRFFAERRGFSGVVLMEQVPGLLSSHGGEDFRRTLSAFLDVGARDVGWRVLDGQFFGVPQRRRRLFFVADFRGRRAGEVLAFSEGLQGNTRRSREARKDVAGALTQSLGAGGADDNKAQAGHIVFDPVQVTSPLHRASESPGRPCHTLHSRAPAVAIRTAQTSSNGWGVDCSDTAYTLDGANGQAVSQVQWASGGGQIENPTAQTLRANAEANYQFIERGRTVRRLTPRECERLQGWQDDHTRWAADGSELSDCARYKMIGNGVIAHVAEWLGRNLLRGG